MTFETFSSGDSILHRIDARVKMGGAAALILVTALAQHPATALAGLLLGCLFLFLSRLPLLLVLRRLIMVNSFVLMLWLTLPLTYPGQPLVLGPLELSRDGLQLALLITLKANAVFLFFIALPATSGIVELAHGLQSMGVPVKLCLLALFSQRYILVIEQEYQRLYRAARLRCFTPSTTLHTYRTIAYLFAMTLVRSWNRAQRVSMAMALRGFQGRFHPLIKAEIKTRDHLALAGLSALTLLLAVFDLGHFL